MIKDSTTRVQKYLDRLATAKGYHKECIHTFFDKDGNEIPLLVSDLKELCQFALDSHRAPLSDEQIENLRCSTFSTSNPFCLGDVTMRKAVRAAEHAHGITQEKQV